MENEKLYRQYAELNSQIKELEEKKKGINLKIIEDLEGKEGNQMKADFGTFSLVERKSWKYTDSVKEKEVEVKKLKKKEEEEGVAEATVSKSLRFQGK